MMPFVIIIILQLVIAAVVIFVLKRLLDRELEKAAVEKLMAFKPQSKVEQAHVYHAGPLSLALKQELTAIVKNKFSESKIVFEQAPGLKGGLVIKVADEMLDFSLISRLEHFWS